jgi:polyisoprenoid-binding protein YceI
MTVEQLEGNVRYAVTANDFTFESIQFSIPVKSLKSGKSKMDKNTYEALKEDKHKEINFISSEVISSKALSNNTYEVVLKGNLSIAGTTKNVQLPVNINTATSKITAVYNLNMIDFNIDPPTAVFGTIKTGESVSIHFTINIIK